MDFVLVPPGSFLMGSLKGGRFERPVHEVMISRKKLKQRAPGRAFALPTEAQWEHACRAGSTTDFHYGDDASQLGDYAWFEGNMIWPNKPDFQGKAFYHDVGTKKPNAFGLYDMHGGRLGMVCGSLQRQLLLRFTAG